MPANLISFFNPKSVAVVGASQTPEKIGAIVLKNLINSKYTGKIYPVNPNFQNIANLECFKDLNSIPEVVDLVVVAVPAEVVPQILIQIGEKGIKNAVVFAAGFKEIGTEGEKKEKEIIEIAKKFGINLLGPNCLGFVNTTTPINTTFGEPINYCGNLRFITQSGAIAASLFDWCNSTKLGISQFVTLGNKSVLNENDILDYFYNQTSDSINTQNRQGLSNVNPIGLYLESISDGTEFLKIVEKISKKDPIFILKPGKTSAASKAMHSHTGAIAGEDAVLETVLEQSGVIRCNTMEDFFDLSRAFSWENLPNGNKVAIVSNAGGPGVISADSVVENGLELVEFDAATKEQLLKVLPRASSILNPVDVLGDALAQRYADACEIILNLDSVNALIVLLTPQVMTQVEETARLIGELSIKYSKPIFCSFIGGSFVAKGEEKLNEYKIPSFRFPERAIWAVSKMYKYKQNQLAQPFLSIEEPDINLDINPSQIQNIFAPALTQKHSNLDNIEANTLIKLAGIPTPTTAFVSNLGEAENFAKQQGWPVVLKISSPGLVHKKEIGGVIVDITNEQRLDEAFSKIELKIKELDTEIQKNVKIQIQKGVIEDVEVILGIKKDPTFGPVLLFGAGGSYAELIKDKNIHRLPISFSEAKQLVEKSKVYSLLKTLKGEPEYPLNKLYEAIVRLGKLSSLVPQASEIEINPIIINLNGIWAVDSKVMVNQVTTIGAPTAPNLFVANTLSAKILATKFHQYNFESENPLNFKPGQYISVKVAPDAIRAYSIATRYSSTNFDLLVDTRPGGPGSKFFENLKVNDKITYLGPFGVFTFIEEDVADTLLFFATGSGISAIRCMIDVALTEKNIQKSINLYFGLTSDEEIFWKDHFDELAAKYSNFKYKIVLSKPSENWKGDIGFVTEFAKQDFPDACKCSAYICGNKLMLDAVTTMLKQNGCPETRIYTERFV